MKPNEKLPRWTGEPRELSEALNLLAERIESVAASVPSLSAGRGMRLVSSSDGVVLESTAKGGALSSSAHPFKVIDASDGTGPKVRVLPGICNFSFPTVGGLANDITDAADHAANAPRIAITETCFVAIIPDGVEGPLPATLDIGTITSPAATPAGVPLAKVTLSDGAITGIYQLVFDIVGLAALDYGPAFGVSYAVTR